MAIRLSHQYSILSDEPKSRQDLFGFSQEVMVRLNSIMENANSNAAGFYDAVFDLVENQAVMVVGPNQAKIVNQMSRNYPFQSIYSLVLPDSHPKDEFYIRRGSLLEGPYPIDEIHKKLMPSNGSYRE
jgi:hypothetical protein